MPGQNQDQVLLIPTDPREENKARDLKRWTVSVVLLILIIVLRFMRYTLIFERIEEEHQEKLAEEQARASERTQLQWNY